MSLLLKMIGAGLCALALQIPAFAAERGSADEAAALVKKAVAYLKANGKEKAYAEFSNPNGKFKDRDLYILVYDMQGNNKAHGVNPRMIGKNLIDIKDADGVLIVKMFIETAMTKGSGWVDYKWPNPVTGAIEKKSTYVERVDDILIGSGIYK